MNSEQYLNRLSKKQFVRLVATCARSVAYLEQSQFSFPMKEPISFLEPASLQKLSKDKLREMLIQWLHAIIQIVDHMVKTYGDKADYETLFNVLRQSAETLGFNYRQIVFELHSLLPFWGAEDTRSGFGSTMDSTTSIRTALPKLLAKYDIQTLLDAGCGDFHWIRHIEWEAIQIKYFGVDIVPDIIATNKSRFSSPQISFKCADITQDELSKADAVLCRECLFHLSVEDVGKAILNFKRTGAEYLFASTFPLRKENRSIATGDFHPINLQIEPYNFPDPLELISDALPEKRLGLWMLEKLP